MGNTEALWIKHRHLASLVACFSKHCSRPLFSPESYSLMEESPMYFEWLLSCWDSVQSAPREHFIHAKNLLPGGVEQLKMGLGDRDWDSAAWLCKVSRDGTRMSGNPKVRHVFIVTQHSKALRRETYSLHLPQTSKGFSYVPQGTFCLI